jgi:hypothetical protein
LFMVLSSLAILIIFNLGSKKILCFQTKFSYWQN